MTLTALQVEHAGSGKGKSLGIGKHHDEHGLYLEVRNATSKSWTGRHTINGKERWIGIGPVKDIPLKRARELHAENRRLVAEGTDPIEHRKALDAAAAIEAAKTVTFEEIAKQYIAAHEAGWKNRKHRRDWPNSLASYAYPIVGQLAVQSIDTTAAMRVLQQLVDGTTFWLARPETASRVRSRCELIWDAAKVQGYCHGENPFRWRGHLKSLLPRTSRVRRVRHHPAVPYRELPAVIEALRARISVSARVLEFCILTVARTSEVIAPYWREFDLEAATWTIPPERMKGDRPHVVPLSRRALEIITEQMGGATPKPDDLVWDLSDGALSKMLRLLGRTETVHGTARSSFKDWAVECTSFSDAVSESCLAHIEGDRVKAAYQRTRFDQMRRELLQLWSDYCSGRDNVLKPDFGRKVANEVPA
jgi:integrase